MKKHMKKHWIIALSLCVGIVIVLGGVKSLQIVSLVQAASSMLPPPETISSYQVKEAQWESSFKAVASLEAERGVEVSNDIPGRIIDISFKPGAKVKQGDVLLRQDISSEQAQLRSAEAGVQLAQANLTRAKELWRNKVVSKAEFDRTEAEFKQALALADEIRTVIDKKTITAPFDGRLGIRLVDIGQDLSEGSAIVTLQSISSIFANFYLPQHYARQLSPGLEVRLSTNAAPQKIFTGKLTAISPSVDDLTRNVQLQATFDNPSEVLLPGMFASIEVVLPEIKSVQIIPITAVLNATYGDSVYVLENNEKDELIARQQFVKLGEARGDFVAVETGLKAGQTVASAGLFKLRNGAPVSLNNDVMPDYQIEPKPADK